MATGIVGSVNNGTLNYTPSSNAKVVILATNNSSSSSAFNVGGNTISLPPSITTTIGPFWVGSGKTLVVTTPTNVTALVSALES